MSFSPTAFAFRIGVLLLWIISASVASAAEEGVDFAHDIVPLLKARCAKCHTNGTYKGSLSMDTREALLDSGAVAPGKSDESELVARITSDDPDLRMPPEEAPLSEKEVALFRAWIDRGLKWEEGFSFRQRTYVASLRPRTPDLPPAQEGFEHPIDRFVADYWERHGIEPPPLADDGAYARRVYLDLIGLLPTPEDIEAFLSDTSRNRHSHLIDRALADPRLYADHWMAFWNDHLRNEYRGTGYIDNGRKQISQWLYQSLLENKPYDVFVRELISPSPESEGFINGIQWRGRVNASQTREIQFSQNISQVFFGVNMKCASCHDSFIDDWKLDDAYSLAAVFADKPLEIHRCDTATGKTASPRFLFPELGDIDAAAPKPERLAQLAGLVTHAENGRFARTIVNRVWQRMLGRGVVHPVDVMANEPWSEEVIDYLASYFVKDGYDLKNLMRHIALSRTYRSKFGVQPEETPSSDFVFQGPLVKRMTAEQFLDAVWMLTGAGPAAIDAPFTPPDFAEATPPAHRFVRVSLVHSDPLMRSLGRPNREQVVTTRGDVLTTLEALDLSNGEILASTLERGAERLLKANPDATSNEVIESIFLQALSREPSSEERAAAAELLGEHISQSSLADFLWAVVMLPEFQLIR